VVTTTPRRPGTGGGCWSAAPRSARTISRWDSHSARLPSRRRRGGHARSLQRHPDPDRPGAGREARSGDRRARRGRGREVRDHDIRQVTQLSQQDYTERGWPSAGPRHRRLGLRATPAPRRPGTPPPPRLHNPVRELAEQAAAGDCRHHVHRERRRRSGGHPARRSGVPSIRLASPELSGSSATRTVPKTIAAVSRPGA